MRVVDPGHLYALAKLDNRKSRVPTYLRFVKREGDKYPGNVGHYAGTNIQEVLRAVIDRVKYLDNQVPSERNQTVLTHLRLSIAELELRAAERHGRVLDLPPDGVNHIEMFPTCQKCGHIGCEGECHA